EERCRSVEVSEAVEGEAAMSEAAAAEAGSDEEREVARLDPLLHRRALLLGQAARLDRLVDAVLEGLLERGIQLRRVDAELLRRVVDDRLALVVRRQPVGGEGAAGAHHGQGGGGACCELRALLHPAPFGRWLNQALRRVPSVTVTVWVFPARVIVSSTLSPGCFESTSRRSSSAEPTLW